MLFCRHTFKRWQWVLIQRVWYLLCWEMESCYGDKAEWQLAILSFFQLVSRKRLSIFPKETWLSCSISQGQMRGEKCKTVQKMQKLCDARNILSWGCCIPTLLLASLKSLLGCSDTAEAKGPQKDLCRCRCLQCLSYVLPDEPEVFSLMLSRVVHPLPLWELGQVRYELGAVVLEETPGTVEAWLMCLLFSPWESFPRAWLVLTPACPRGEGCRML